MYGLFVFCVIHVCISAYSRVYVHAYGYARTIKLMNPKKHQNISYLGYLMPRVLKVPPRSGPPLPTSVVITRLQL